jgi:hypothetical protein
MQQTPMTPEEMRAWLNNITVRLYDSIKGEILAFFHQQETGLASMLIKKIGKEKFVNEVVGTHYIPRTQKLLDALTEKVSDPHLQRILKARKETVAKLARDAIAIYGKLFSSIMEQPREKADTLRDRLLIAGSITPLHAYKYLQQAVIQTSASAEIQKDEINKKVA